MQDISLILYKNNYIYDISQLVESIKWKGRKGSAARSVNVAGSSSAGGAANSAVKLQTARTINGVSFNGTANIDLPSGRTWNCGGNVGETKGWYHFMTKSMDVDYEDFNLTLSVQDTHAGAAKYGIFHVHIRQENDGAACTKPNVFGWIIRSGWNAGDIVGVISGRIIKFYIYSDTANYNHISFVILHQSDRSSYIVSNLTLVASNETVSDLTPDVVSKDIGVVFTAGSAEKAKTVSASQTNVYKQSGMNSSQVTIEIPGLFTKYKAVICNIINGGEKVIGLYVLPLSYMKTLADNVYYEATINAMFYHIDDNTLKINTGFSSSAPTIGVVEIISLY